MLYKHNAAWGACVVWCCTADAHCAPRRMPTPPAAAHLPPLAAPRALHPLLQVPRPQGRPLQQWHWLRRRGGAQRRHIHIVVQLLIAAYGQAYVSHPAITVPRNNRRGSSIATARDAT